MKGGDESHYCRRLFLFVVFTILFAMLSTNVGAGECLSATNLTAAGGTVADFMEAGGGGGCEEFLMDSETNSRFLPQMSPTNDHLIYKVLHPKIVPSNKQRYSGSLGVKHNGVNLHCDFLNRGFFTFFVMLSTNVGAGECLSATNLTAGGGTVADFMEAGGGGGGEEFLMDSETSGRFLGQIRGHISTDVLRKNYVPCGKSKTKNRNVNCLGIKQNTKRPCDLRHRTCNK
nr:protein RALF-like 33 [Ipomoea batatas]GME20738.1 protein RALF-like 33 [Ipomoea batatas]